MKSRPPMLRFVGGPIVTMDAGDPVAGEVVTAAGRIAWVGRRGSAPTEFRRARTIDLKGRLLLPAFADSHTHFLHFARSLDALDLRGARTLRAALARIAAHARASHRLWVIGNGFDVNLWGGQWPTSAHLDRILPDRPAAIFSHDEHALWANTEALRHARIHPDSPDPVGGKIARDGSGAPTGILFEGACRLVWDQIPLPTLAETERMLRRAQAEAHKAGVAAVGDMGEPATLAALVRMRQHDRLRLRVWKSIALKDLDSAIRLGLHSGFGDEWIKIGSVKMFLDGALGSRTAWLRRPYVRDPSYRGICRMEQEEFRDAVRRSTSHGLSVCVHAIGDAAVGQAIAILSQFRSRFPRGQPPRIEHLQLVAPGDRKHLPGSGIIASMQPSHLLTDRDYVDRHWGRRGSGAFVLRSLWDLGVPLAFGSDAPVERLLPIEGIGAAVWRARPDDPRGPWYPRQRLSIWEALWGFTVGAAFAAGDDGWRGRIMPGQAADLVVLDRNLFAVAPKDIFAAQVTLTVVDGECVYDAEA